MGTLYAIRTSDGVLDVVSISSGFHCLFILVARPPHIGKPDSFGGFLKDSQVCASLFDSVDHFSDITFVRQVYVKKYSKEKVAMDGSKFAEDRVLKQTPPLYGTVLNFPIGLGSLYLITENSVSQRCSLLEGDSPYLTIRSDIDRSIWRRV